MVAVSGNFRTRSRVGGDSRTGAGSVTASFSQAAARWSVVSPKVLQRGGPQRANASETLHNWGWMGYKRDAARVVRSKRPSDVLTLLVRSIDRRSRGRQSPVSPLRHGGHAFVWRRSGKATP